MGNTMESFISLFSLIVGVAIVAVLVSNKSNTSNVIKAFGQAFSSSLGVAVSPVTGSSYSTSLPSLGNF
jgi:membrane DNA delivery protein